LLLVLLLVLIVWDRVLWPGHGAQHRAFRRHHRCPFVQDRPFQGRVDVW